MLCFRVKTPSMRLALLTLAILCVCAAQGQNFESRLTPPETKAAENEKYHKPDVVGTPDEVRMHGYQHRLDMEAHSPYAAIKWRSIGPEKQGGRVIDFAIPKKDPHTYYVAYATGGLWRSRTDGVTWEPLFDHESAFSIGSIAVSDDGKTIWIGTGENNAQRTSYPGMGMFKSTDEGKTWNYMGLAETHRIGKVLLDPKDSNTVYVGALGHLYSKSDARGVYKTTDGGRNWTHVLSLDEHTGIIDMQMDPRDHNVLYASAWQMDRRPWDFLEGGPGTAIYKSTDAGHSWRKIDNGLPSDGQMGRIGLALCPSKPDRIYAYIDNQGPYPDTLDEDEEQPSGTITPHRFAFLDEAEFLQLSKEQIQTIFTRAKTKLKPEDVIQQVKDKKLTMDQLRAKLSDTNKDLFQEDRALSEVYRSDDGGEHWQHIRRIGPQGGYYWGRIYVNPVNPDEVYATGAELLKSTDGGITWKQAARYTHGDSHLYYIDPKNPNFQVLGDDGGLFLSYDAGEHWRHMENMAVGQLTTVAVDEKFPYNVIGGLQDNGTMRGPSTYSPGGSDPSLWNTIYWGDGAAIGVDPRDGGDLLYVSFQFGEAEALNTKTKENWPVHPTAGEGEPPLRYNWVSPIVVSPHHPDIVYFGTNKLFRSLDQGKHWEALGEDVTKNLPNGNVPFSTIKDLSESPFKFGLVYVGCDDGTVKVTKNHGDTWTAIPTPKPDVWVTRVLASKWDKATVYVTQSGYRESDFTPYAWKSTDYGAHWTSIAGDLPPEPVNVIREDPNHKELLYLGTDMGAFVSRNGGAHWDPLCGGIPHIPVHDLAVQGRDNELVAGTHGRSAWVLSLDKIYSLNDDTMKKDLVLTPVENMTASKRWGYSRPSLETEPTPTTPEIKGEIWTKTAGPAVLRLKSKDGKVVLEKKLDLLYGFNAYTLSLQLTPPKPIANAKLQRKINSVQDALADPYAAYRATYVPAGSYTLELQQGDKTASVKWTLSPAT